MHGAVVTAFGGGGHVFFEDISLNPFQGHPERAVP